LTETVASPLSVDVKKSRRFARHIALVVVLGGVCTILTEWAENTGRIGDLAEDVSQMLVWSALLLPLVILAWRDFESPQFRRAMMGAFAVMVAWRFIDITDEIKALDNVPLIGKLSSLHSGLQHTGAIALGGMLLLVYYRLFQEVAAARDNLQVKVDERTAALAAVNQELQQEIRNREAAEATLRESERRFRQAVASSPFPIMIHAEDGEVLEINEVWSDLTGYSHDAIPTIENWTQRAYGKHSQRAREGIRELFKIEERHEVGDVVIQTSCGGKRVWNFNIAPLGCLPDGRKLLISSANDVTDRLKSEQAVRLSEKKYRDLIETTGFGYTILDASGVVLDANDAFVRLTGRESLDEVRGQSVTEWTAEHDRARNAAEVQQCLESRVTKNLEIDYVAPDGRITPIEIHGTAVDTPEGLHILGLCQDITTRRQNEVELERSRAELEDRVQRRTAELSAANHELKQEVEERKRAESELREVNQRLQDLAKNVPGILFQLCAGGDGSSVEIPYVSSGIKRLLGVDAEEIIADPRISFDLVEFDDSSEFRQRVREVALSGTPFKTELRCTARDGESKWISVSAVAHQQPDGARLYNGIAIEITEQKRAEQAIKVSEQRFRDLVEGSIQGILIHRDFEPLFVNEAYASIYGYSPGELLLMESIFPLTAPADRTRMNYYKQSRMRGGNVPSHYRCHGVRKDGTEITLEQSARLIDWEGQPAIQITAVDISEREHAEAQLRQNEATFRQFADNIHEVLWMRSPDYQELTYVSPAYESIWGRSVEEIHSNPAEWMSAIHPEDRERVESSLYSRLEGAGWAEEYRILRADGALRWIHDRGVPVKDENGAVVRLVGIAEDVTESKLAAEQLRQQRDELAHVARLSTMGEMASGLAHELNQPLSAIGTYSSSGLIGLESGSLSIERWREVLQKINTQAQRAGDIINRLKTLVAKRAPHRTPIDVNELVHDVASLVDSELRTNHVRLNLELQPNLPSAHADPVQIQQVLVNLLMNGIDAVSSSPLDQRSLSITTSKHGEQGVEVCIADSGPGVSLEHLEQVFEPFFTTKDAGMGMGLSISRSIIEAHGGKLSIDAGREGGAAFIFDLPVE